MTVIVSEQLYSTCTLLCTPQKTGGGVLKCNIKGGGRSIEEWGRKGSIEWGWDGWRKSRDEGWLRMGTRMSIEVACLCFQVVCVSIVRILSVYWTPRLGDIIARMEKYRRYWFLCSARLTRSFSLKNALEAREFLIQIQIWSQHYIFKPKGRRWVQGLCMVCGVFTIFFALDQFI